MKIARAARQRCAKLLNEGGLSGNPGNLVENGAHCDLTLSCPQVTAAHIEVNCGQREFSRPTIAWTTRKRLPAEGLRLARAVSLSVTSYYETNEYGAQLLRQAVNNGYAQGFLAGQAARQDRWSSRYQDSYAYQDAHYGYDGYYVDRDDYNFYFREGFSRGYEDGYNSRYQYGQYSGGSYSILGGILSQILNFQSLR